MVIGPRPQVAPPPAKIDEVTLPRECQPRKPAQALLKDGSLESDRTRVRVVEESPFELRLAQQVHEVRDGFVGHTRQADGPGVAVRRDQGSRVRGGKQL